MEWLKNILDQKGQTGKSKLPYPVAYKGRGGQRIYLYHDWSLSSDDELDVGINWETVEQLSLIHI